MELYTLKINVTNQRLSFGENPPEIYSGDQSIDFVEFTFTDDTWNFPNIWAIFYRQKGAAYQIALDDNKVMIPAEVMQKRGYVYIGLMATDGENVQTSSVLQYSIRQGAANVETVTPSPSIYEQFLNDLEAYQEAIHNLETLAATAVTLPEGSDATASFDNGILELGIPKGDTGATGNGIQSITKTSTSGSVDTYTITYTNGNTTTFNVTNGEVTLEELNAEVQPIKNNVNYLKRDLLILNDLGEPFFSSCVKDEVLLTNGTIQAYNGYTRTDYIDCTGLKKVKVYVPQQTSFAGWFDSTKTSFQQQTFSVGENEYAVPSGKKYLVISASSTYFSDIRIWGKRYYDIENIHEEIDIIQEDTSLVKERITDIDGRINVKYEVGNMGISNSGWTYVDSTTRIRTPQGYTVPLEMGDIIKIPSTSRAYIGCLDEDGNYSSYGWLIDDFVIRVTGDYVILITAVPETTVTDVLALADSIKIYRHNNISSGLFDIQDGTPTGILSINHRGFNSVAPENTLPAYIESAKRGFNYVETDVQFTSDNIPVLLHDQTINRTARNMDGTTISGDVYIKNITYSQALNYDFGIWKDPAYAGTKIPTLEEFVVLCKNLGLHPYIELKSDVQYSEAQIHAIIDIVNNNGLKNRATYISFSQPFLLKVVNYDETARVGYVCGAITNAIIYYAIGLRTGKNNAFIDAYINDLDSTAIETLQEKDIPLEIWESSDVNVETYLTLSPYITGFTSNENIVGKIIREYLLNN